MRIMLFSLLLIVLHVGPLSAQSGAPSWYFDKGKSYPDLSFITATGEGKTRAEAETAAVAQISLYFNTSTEVRNEAIRQFNQSVTNNTTDFSKKTYITESVVIKSEEEFLGVRFAAPWQDQRRGVWTALAYINREEAAQIYDSKIAANMAVINSLATDASGDAEPLYVVSLLARAQGICDLVEEYIKAAAVVDTQSTHKHKEDSAKIQEIRSNYRSERDSLRFTVAVTSPENSGRIERKLNDLFEDSGYVTTPSGGMYTVNVKLTGNEVINDAGNFVTLGLVVRIERAGNIIFSYSKNYDRFGHRTSMSTAYTRALYPVEEDLEENFMQKFTAMLGR
jgi:hypothetical protein